MKKIFISGAHGSACSLVKSLAIGNVQIDPKFATCHESWAISRTQNQQNICFNHTFDRKLIQQIWDPNITIWIKIADENITLICRRVVILDFIYTNDPEWIEKDWCWTAQKHQRLAGPDWPSYSKNIFDYPSWCLDEMCHVVWERSRPWMTDREDFDYTISSDELFGNSPRKGLDHCFSDLGLKIDHVAIDNWKQKNSEVLKPFIEMFSWTPQWQPPQEWVTLPIDEIK